MATWRTRQRRARRRKKAGRDKKRRRGVLDLPKAIEERLAEGRAERESVPLEAHGEWATPDRPSGPGRHPREAERDARARARADPARADDRLAVHVLPRERGDHGVGSVAHPDDGVACAVLRRCAPVELRRVRGAGSPCRVRSQRLRRDAAGAVRVGRQAPGGERRRRRPWQRPPSQGAAGGGARCRRGLSDDDGQGGDDALPGCLVHAVRRRQGDRGSRSDGRTRPRSSPLRRRWRRRRRGRAWARCRSSRSGSTAATGSSSSHR